MTIERIRALYNNEPFQPFIMHLADGRSIEVPHREFLALGPTGRTIVAYDAQDNTHFVDVLMITDLVVRPNGSSRSTRRRGR